MHFSLDAKQILNGQKKKARRKNGWDFFNPLVTIANFIENALLRTGRDFMTETEQMETRKTKITG